MDELAEELGHLPLEDRVAALADLLEALEKRLEATEFEGESADIDAEGETLSHPDAGLP